MTTTTNPRTETDNVESDAQVIAELAVAACAPRPIDGPVGRFVSVVTPPGSTSTVHDLDVLRQATDPLLLWKKGAYTIHTAASFIEYVNRHTTDQTEVFADDKHSAIAVVFDSHGAFEPGQEFQLAGRSDHTAILKLRHTEAWDAWVKGQGLTDQASFAEHIEDRLPDIIDPDAATFLEIAQSLTASTSVEFEHANRLTDGQVRIGYRETMTARAGQKGDLTIPATFAISVAPWQGANPWKVTGRLRYRLSQGDLQIGYKLDNLDTLLTAAFRDVVATIDDAILPTIIHGWPDRNVRLAA